MISPRMSLSKGGAGDRLNSPTDGFGTLVGLSLKGFITFISAIFAMGPSAEFSLMITDTDTYSPRCGGLARLQECFAEIQFARDPSFRRLAPRYIIHLRPFNFAAHSYLVTADTSERRCNGFLTVGVRCFVRVVGPEGRTGRVFWKNDRAPYNSHAAVCSFTAGAWRPNLIG